MKNQFNGIHLNFIGFSTFFICVIHCAIIPFILSLVPLAGFKALNNSLVENGFVFLSFSLSSSALIHGYRKNYKKLFALVIAYTGFIFFAIGQILGIEWQEIILTTSSVIFIAIAHFINWRHLKQSQIAYFY